MISRTVAGLTSSSGHGKKMAMDENSWRCCIRKWLSAVANS